MSSVIERIISGSKIGKEYPCVDHNLLKGAVKVYFKTNELIDITNRYLFLGYSPLIVGIYFTEDDAQRFSDDEQTICFIAQEVEDNNSLASITVRKITEKKLPGYVLFLYEGVKAQHQLISSLRQRLLQLHSSLSKKPKGNVNVPGNLYEQVRVFYTVPRIISLVVVSDGTLYNVFPTDLHGRIGYTYVDSLRSAGLASNQVKQYKRILLCKMKLTAKDDVYAMGKNHMKPLRESNEFQFEGHSPSFRFPIPQQAVSYYELEQESSLEIGIHRLHFFNLINEHEVDSVFPILSCVHRLYLQWRMNHHLATEYI